MDNSFEKLINRVLDGRYKIENVVGIGGMAYVLKAVDLQMNNRTVAIKVLNEEFNCDENAVKRFVNESEAVSMVDSEYIVKIIDIVINDNLKYIVMEFIDGITLKDYIDKVGSLGWKEAVHYTRQILKGLSHAHEKGIIHRDVKPQNIMLLRDGKVKITDFGIAKTPTSESLTMTDKAIGTVNYISPEQASGGVVDEKSDLYSVGVMLYEMLSGKLPFVAETAVAVAMMQVSEEPVPPRILNPQIPRGLEQIVIKAMNKSPEERFNCAASMEKALEYFVKNPDVVFAGAPSTTTGKESVDHNFDKQKNQQDETKHRSMFPIILGVTTSFFVVVLASVIYLFFASGIDKTDSFGDAVDKLLQVDSNNDAEDEFVVHSFVGERYSEELEKKANELGYSVMTKKVKQTTGNEVPMQNTVVRQSPKEGQVIKKPKDGEKVAITLYIYEDESVERMPNCINTSRQAAVNQLVKRFEPVVTVDNIEIVEEFHDTVRKGQVYDSIPSPNEKIDLMTLKVTLFVSKGPEPREVTMPEVVGMLYVDARKTLEKENIKNVIREDVESTEPVNTVVDVSIAAGDVIMDDSEVILYVSKKIKNTGVDENPEDEGDENTDENSSDEPSGLDSLLDLRGKSQE